MTGNQAMAKDGQPGSRRARQRIGDRDGWVCGICKFPINPELSVYQSVWAGVVDHIISRRDHGGDRDHNLQIAHYDCNRRKHAISGEGTTRIITCHGCGDEKITRAERRTTLHCPCGTHITVPPLGIPEKAKIWAST